MKIIRSSNDLCRSSDHDYLMSFGPLRNRMDTIGEKILDQWDFENWFRFSSMNNRKMYFSVQNEDFAPTFECSTWFGNRLVQRSRSRWQDRATDRYQWYSFWTNCKTTRFCRWTSICNLILMKISVVVARRSVRFEENSDWSENFGTVYSERPSNMESNGEFSFWIYWIRIKKENFFRFLSERFCLSR